MASPLASFNLSRKRAEEEKVIVGFLTMEDFKGMDFNDDFHRSLSSIDRLCEVLCVRIRKNEQEKQLKDGFAGKRIKPSSSTPTDSNIDSKLKRKYDGDEDWSASEKKTKTKKRVYTKNNKTSYVCPPPDLPEEYKKLIIGKMNGTELTLLIQKKLYPTDVNPNHNRLSLPPLQVLSGSFLTSNEIETLNPKHSRKSRDLGFLNIPFIDPSLKLKEKKGINLSLWTLSNSNRKSYVLKTGWGKVVKKNKLVAGDVIQVWSFRANGNQLHLAIVLVQRAKECSNQSGGSSHVFCGDHGIEWGGM
ncbi:B3 domain-containing protein [Pyrus ussuriensis x Pyrus communis]|uniref:B3 domain-containing protein n=1 Tax=Pyrus ussuriensis x Pyrus communis TaxID=2448454 RepID=A0A5N5G3K6_9ROSA|nr:B3 domain-containing protein [Pyrus ussuriensis x Pyrus communis]